MAPLLALFGEQVTKQYLGESFHWEDNLLFALAPLGIITAMVAAIRVSGNPILKSLIGRAKETRGYVEADLMSSTSSDVCELWSGDGVVRVIGTPDLLQIVWVPKERRDTDWSHETKGSCGLYNFREKETRDLHYSRLDNGSNNPLKRGQSARGQADEQLRKEDGLLRRNPPNLSINLSVRPVRRLGVLFLFIFIGFLLQSGVLAFAAVTQYTLGLLKNNTPVPNYAFPVLLVGTIALATGVFLCAQAVETSTKEILWRPKITEDTHVLWLQKGGQKVGDQQFEAFARRTQGDIVTSHRDVVKGREALVTVAVLISFFGFVAQFFALRAAHSSVTVVQLFAILLVTIMRSLAHLQRNDENEIPNPQQVEGFELDWLAKYLGNLDSWEVVTGISTGPSVSSKRAIPIIVTPAALPGPSKQKPSMPATASTIAVHQLTLLSPTPTRSSPLPSPQVASFSAHRPMTPIEEQPRVVPPSQPSPTAMTKQFSISKEPQVSIYGTDPIIGNISTDEIRNYDPYEVMKARARLAILSSDWDLNVRKNVLILQNILEKTMNDIFSKMSLKPEFIGDPDFTTFIWTVPVRVSGGKQSVDGYRVDLTMTRSPDEVSGWSSWKADETELEAVLCLWASSLGEQDRKRQEDGLTELQNLWLIGPSTDEVRSEHHVWIYRSTPHKSIRISPEGRYFGWTGSGDEAHITQVEFLAVENTRELEKICTQHLYYIFLRNLASMVGSVGGETMIRPPNNPRSGDIAHLPAPAKSSGVGVWTGLALMNTNLASLASIFDDCPLGTIEEAYCCIIPAFEKIHKPQETRTTVVAAQEALLGLERAGNWQGSADVNIYLMAYMQSADSPPGETRKVMETVYGSLHRLTMAMISELEFAITPERRGTIEIMWNTLYATCKKMSIQRQSPDLGLELIILCLTWSKVKRDSGPDSQGIRRLMKMTMRALYQAEQQDVLDSKVDNATPDTFWDPEALTRFLWADIAQPWDKIENFDYSLPSKKFIEARKLTGHMFSSERFKAYILEPDAVQDMRDTTVFKGLTKSDIDNSSTPIDLLLIRGYRTPLQMAVEINNQNLIERLLPWLSFPHALDLPAPCGGRTALQAAAGAGLLNVVTSLLNMGARIDASAAATSGRTALQAAAENGHEDIVEYLLTKEADINEEVAPEKGISVLQAAAQSGNLNLVLKRIKAGAKVNPERLSAYGRTPLQAAAEYGHLKVVEELIKHGARIDALPAAIAGRTALQGAAEKGHLDVVKYLIRHSAEIHCPPAPTKGRTALQAASGAGKNEVVQYLLKRSVNTNEDQAKKEGRTALHAAIEGGYTDIARLLLKYGAPVIVDKEPNTLKATLDYESPEMVELILSTDFDLHAALHYAIENNREAIYNQLLKHKSLDINRKEKGTCALIKAAKYNHYKVVQWLASLKNMEVNSQEQDGSTALGTAAAGGYNDIVVLLLDCEGIQVNLRDNKGRTPLIIAAAKGHENVLTTLLSDFRVDSKIYTKEGNSYLLEAIRGGHERLVTVILNQPESEDFLNLANDEGITPLILAAQTNSERITLQFLNRVGVNRSHKDKKGRTAFFVASEYGSYAVLKVLKENLEAEIMTELDSDNRSSLLVALEGDFRARAIVSTLLEIPGICDQINHADSRGVTPIFAAIRSGDQLVIKELLATNKVNVNAADRRGRTPLMIATEDGKPEIVRELLRVASIKTDVTDNDGSTALSLAKFRDIKALLIAHSAKNVPGRSADSGTVGGTESEDEDRAHPEDLGQTENLAQAEDPAETEALAQAEVLVQTEDPVRSRDPELSANTGPSAEPRSNTVSLSSTDPPLTRDAELGLNQGSSSNSLQRADTSPIPTSSAPRRDKVYPLTCFLKHIALTLS